MKVPAAIGIVFWCTVLAHNYTLGQGLVTGRVIDGSTKKPVRDASIKVADTALQTTTNFLGFFQLTVDSDNTLLVYKDGYDTGKVKVPPVSKFQIELFRDTIPEYKGGMRAFYDYIESHLIYPPEAHRLKIHGWVYVAFDVDSLKGVQNIRIIKDIGGLCGSVVAKTIYDSPNTWFPKTKLSTLILPVRFVLTQREVRVPEDAPTVELPRGILLGNITVTAVEVSRDSYSRPPGQ